MLPALAVGLLFLQGPTLENLEKQAASRPSGHDWQAGLKANGAINEGVVKLIDQNKLAKTEFERASQLIMAPQTAYRLVQAKYELSLAGLASANPGSEKTIAAKWDELMMSMGRPRRIGIAQIEGDETFEVKPTAKRIMEILRNPENARKDAKESKDNAEIQKLVDDDQADRKADFSKMTMAQIEDIGKRDRERLQRIRQLVAEGAPKTAKDHANAALVYQHGHLFDDYATSHELCIVAMILGDARASWLAGASYDRMLSHSGHPQRFATQYTMGPNGYELEWFDEGRINDTIRVAVVRKTLEQAKAVKFLPAII